MKNLKKLTFLHKQLLSKKKLDPKEWGLKSETNDQIVIVNRETGEEKVLNK